MASRLEPIPARSNEKSKNGCQNCKKRKVKCDEQHPLCGNCARRFPNLLRCFDDPLPVAVPEIAELSETEWAALLDAAQQTGAQRETHANVVPMVVPQLPGVIGGGLVDPFETHPATRVPNYDVLLRHYLSSLVLQSFPFFHTGAVVELWWPFLRADDILFHISLYLSARNIEALGGHAEGNQSKLVKIEALRLLNEVIQRNHQISDQILVSVANFITIEHEAGNTRTQNTHTAGLKRMIELRGGMDTIKSTNPMAASIIFWMSMLAMNGPQFLPMQFRRAVNEEPRKDPGGSAFEKYGIGKPLLDVLFEANELTARFSLNFHSSSATEGLLVLDQLSSVLQRLLPPSLAFSLPQGSGISESSRFAGALHILFPLMAHYPDPTLMVNALIHKLKESLMYYIMLSEAINPVFLWCLAVGGVSAYQLPERSWFVGHLVVATSELDITSWDHMRTALLGVMSHAVFCNDSFRAVWDEVVSKASV